MKCCPYLQNHNMKNNNIFFRFNENNQECLLKYTSKQLNNLKVESVLKNQKKKQIVPLNPECITFDRSFRIISKQAFICFAVIISLISPHIPLQGTALWSLVHHAYPSQTYLVCLCTDWQTSGRRLVDDVFLHRLRSLVRNTNGTSSTCTCPVFYFKGLW